MTTDRELMQQALNLLESAHVATALVWPRHDCVEALRARLAEPETCKPALQVERADPRRPLTDEEIWDIAANCLNSVAGRLQFARAIERAHKIGGAQ